MKYFPQCIIAIVVAFVGSGAAGSPPLREIPLGPHSGQKFAIVQHFVDHSSIDPNKRVTIALVLTVEQNMKGNQQEIVAKAAAHKDGPSGPLYSAQGIQVRITEPGPVLASQVRNTAEPGEMKVTKSISAPGGKYKTVTADVSMKSSEFPETSFNLTIPGSK